MIVYYKDNLWSETVSPLDNRKLSSELPAQYAPVGLSFDVRVRIRDGWEGQTESTRKNRIPFRFLLLNENIEVLGAYQWSPPLNW